VFTTMPVVHNNRGLFVSCVEDYLRANDYALVLSAPAIAWTRRRIGYGVTSVWLPVDDADIETTNTNHIPDVTLSKNVRLFPLAFVSSKPIAGHHGLLLMSFRMGGVVSADDIDQDTLLEASNLFCSRLHSMGDLQAVPAVLDKFAIGFSHPTRWTSVPHPLLRPDGVFFSYSSDRTLPKLARQVRIPRRLYFAETEMQAVDEDDESTVTHSEISLKAAWEEASAGGKGKGKLKGKGFIIWIRASTESQTEKGTGLERQVVSIINDLQSLANSIAFVLCVVEFCSVEKHRWRDRTMRLVQSLNSLPMTELNGGHKACVLAPTNAQLKGSHSLAEEQGFYTRCHQLYIRVLSSPADRAIEAIRSSLQAVFIKFGMVFYIVRVSVPFSHKQSTEPMESITKQGSFIR
ncbi:hypothetical protein HDV05_001514, partial [Chytridiales sp. JEL 0842]